MMSMPFQTINWDEIPKIEHVGETGTSWWQTIEQSGIRLRVVEYSQEYLADHWCQKGHIIYCLEGEFISEMERGEKIVLKKGMMYIVSDNMSSHRSTSNMGVKLLIIDGVFLR